ncbi:F-box-like domain superfamily [Arabidopsis thaliana x Arabidopsis arenosa]|uniref:F-box-like domain superfamily n=1 Tax=Arabidopsis thaliana x Arabidopsis arenosa TaxID=1240361 RepID=A0A8T2AV04_9BRAS|nr:F-box-like domain superfamily [Arabidopsis thaliana x Arabidopsis arenosa]
MTMTTPELTKDSVEEILCRVPATNLKRLRCTCKQWNRLYKDDERFAREHCDKAAKEVLALMLTEKYRICPMSVNLNGDVPSVEVKSGLSVPDPHFNNSCQYDIAEVFHCDGLLLCTHEGSLRYGSQIVVWNPFTGQNRWIESGNRCKEGKIFVLGYYYQDKNKSCSKSYKVLCLSPFGNDTEIYELNSDSWRTIPDGEITPGYYISDSGHMVSLKGNTYWFAREIAKPHLGISLLGFDFQTEKSSSFCLPLPYQGPLYEILSLSVVREEKLSVFIQPDYTSKTEIWVTSKIDNTTTKGAVSWTKVLSLDLNPDLQITDQVKFLLDEEKKIVLCCERWMVMEDETKSFDKIFILGEDNKVIEVSFGVGITEGCWPAILNYVPSLAPIERAGGKRKKR